MNGAENRLYDKFELLDSEIEGASRLLKALAHPIRLRILCILGHDEVSVHDIVTPIGTSQSNISQHLSMMRDKGILSSRKVANRVMYRIDDEHTLKLFDTLHDIFCKDVNP